MTTALKVSRVQKRGQVTIPIEIRHRLGLEEGDLVAFFETEDGIVISPQKVVPAQKLSQILEEKGVGLEELFTFADRVAPEASGTEESTEVSTEEATASVAAETAGIFQREDRSGPDDFKRLREEFMEETATSVTTEMSNHNGQ